MVKSDMFNLYSAERILTSLLYGEARNQIVKYGENALRAVAWVVINRCRRQNKVHPLSVVKKVMTAKRQFSCFNDDSNQLPYLLKILSNLDEMEKTDHELLLCHNVATAAIDDLANNTNNMVNPVGDSTHYYNPKLCSPKWAQEMIGIPIGDHVFLKVK